MSNDEIAKSCEMCRAAASRYKCPRCLKRTCSLACSTRHKTEEDCDGIRCRSTYVKMKEFSEQHLLSDYRFLEDGIRQSDNASRGNRKILQIRPKYVKTLIREAQRRMITLQIMPYNFSKRRSNQTRFSYKLKTFTWHVDLCFPQADATYTERVEENTLLSKTLEKFVHRSASDPVIRQKLAAYVAHGADQLKAFMKVEGRPANSTRYHKLDMKKTLCDNLFGKTVLEYPTLYVAFGDACDRYPPPPPVKDADDAASKPPVLVTTQKSFFE